MSDPFRLAPAALLALALLAGCKADPTVQGATSQTSPEAQADIKVKLVGYLQRKLDLNQTLKSSMDEIAIANAAGCGASRVMSFGFRAREEVMGYADPAAKKMTPTEIPPEVLRIAPNGSAAGLLAEGDVIVAINGAPTGAGRAMALMLGDGPAKLRVTSANGTRDVTLTPVPACDVDVKVRQRIYVNSKYTDSVDLLPSENAFFGAPTPGAKALVTAHVIAHHLRGQAIPIGKSESDEDVEDELARLSAWMVARAGYDPVAALEAMSSELRDYTLHIAQPWFRGRRNSAYMNGATAAIASGVMNGTGAWAGPDLVPGGS